MTAVVCLDCQRSIQLMGNPEEGDAVTCPNCQAEFELVSLEPPTIEWLYEGYDSTWGDENWDDDDLDESDDDDSSDDDDDDWSWMIAKQRRLQEHADSRRRSQPTTYYE
ncbi:MAG: hypothetical protein HC802_20320 [Caldilineaceae bacterium]|nr:hypothetical protein [Caldilineaceae bacterium]